MSSPEFDDTSPGSAFDPARTYRFVPPVCKRVMENLAYSLGAGLVLATFLLFSQSTPDLNPILAALISAGLAALSFSVMSAPYLSRKVPRWVEVGPRGITVKWRSGVETHLSHDMIRGYVYDGVRYVFVVPGETLALHTFAFESKDRALMRLAIRTPLEHGSMKWRGRSRAEQARGGRARLLIIAVGVLAGLALELSGHRGIALAVLIAMFAYFAIDVVRAFRRRESDSEKAESSGSVPPAR